MLTTKLILCAIGFWQPLPAAPLAAGPAPVVMRHDEPCEYAFSLMLSNWMDAFDAAAITCSAPGECVDAACKADVRAQLWDLLLAKNDQFVAAQCTCFLQWDCPLGCRELDECLANAYKNAVKECDALVKWAEQLVKETCCRPCQPATPGGQ